MIEVQELNGCRMVHDDSIPTERIGMVVYILMANRGRRFTTAYLADKIGLRPHGTWAMLSKLERVLPIVLEPDGWVIY